MKSNSNTFQRGLATLPAQNNLAPPEDGRRRSLSDPPLLSVPEPYQSIPAQELLKDNCGKSGWIRKEGGSFKTWRDRYVILHKGCLYYYQNSEATTTSGKFSLSGYRLSPAPERSNKYPWTFKLVHIQPEKRTFYFAAYSEREMNEWMDNITEEMEEFCGSPKQKMCETTESGDGLEYCYPEVQPRFDPEELAALFGKPSPSLPRKPAAEPAMYCPPPEIEPRDTPKKTPLLPKTPAHSFPKGCNVSNIGAIRPHEGAATLRPGKPFPGSTPVFPLATHLSPTVPSRLAKPAPSQPPPLTPPKPKPKPLPRPPPLEKRSTEPTFMKYQGAPAGGQDEAEITEDYLDIVPDTTPEDVVNEEKKSTLSRGFPDGNSFRRYHSEETLSPSTVTLDMDKTTVNKLLEDRLGVYILRKSENAQSKRALSVWTGDRVRHYLIFYDGKTGYSLDPTEGVYFEDLEDLISHYHKNNLPKCDAKLLRPFKKKEKV